MVTSTKPQPTATPESPSPVDAYRAAVLAAATQAESKPDTPAAPDPTPPPDVLARAEKLNCEWRLDLALARRRVLAVEALRRAGRLEQEAAAMEQEAALDCDAFRRELQERGVELIGSITVHSHSQAAHDLRMAAMTERLEAQHDLLSTADPSIEDRIRSLAGKIEGLRTAMSRRGTLHDLEQRIGEAEAKLEEMGKGPLDTTRRQDAFRSLKQRRADLIAQRPALAATAEADRRDAAEIARHQREIDALQASRLEPACMAWSE